MGVPCTSALVFILTLVPVLSEMSYLSNNKISTELWVAVENKLETTHGLILVNGSHYLTSIAQVNSSTTVFATDVGKSGAKVFKIEDSEEIDPIEIFHDSSVTYFEGVAYDGESDTLYLSSPQKNGIYMLKGVSDNLKGNNASAEFLPLPNVKPVSLAIDKCTRDVYVTSSAPAAVWRVSGGRKELLADAGLHSPRPVTVDQREGKVYWADLTSAGFRLERSRLDGSERELVCEGKNHKPFSLAVDDEFIYWSDWRNHAVWRVHKHADCVASVYKTYESSKPNGLAWVTSEKPACPLKFSANFTEDVPHSRELSYESFGSSSTNLPTVAQPAAPSAPENLVLGEPGGAVRCACGAGATGARCQLLACFNYCLNGAECLLMDQIPTCVCRRGFAGERCQLEDKEVAPNSCAKTAELSYLHYLLIATGSASGLLALITCLLTFLWCKERRKPRIVRKRFVSASRGGGKGGRGGKLNACSSDGVSIDIENCCNMTLCDTPCFEPPNRANNSKNASKKCEDNAALLLDDEGVQPDDDTVFPDF